MSNINISLQEKVAVLEAQLARKDKALKAALEECDKAVIEKMQLEAQLQATKTPAAYSANHQEGDISRLNDLLNAEFNAHEKTKNVLAEALQHISGHDTKIAALQRAIESGRTVLEGICDAHRDIVEL